MMRKWLGLAALLLALLAVGLPAGAQLGINFDRTTTGRLFLNRSVYYVFGARAGQSWVLEVTTRDFDPVVSVFRGDEIYVDDDDGVQPAAAFRNALLSFTTQSTGTYTIRVRDFDGSRAGTFQIRLSPVSTGQAAATTETDATPIVTGQCGSADPGFAAGVRIALRNNYYASRLRAASGLGSNQIATIPSPADDASISDLTSATVTSGPVCRDGFYWYEVSYRGTIGWVAVGRGAEVWWRVVGG